jgi:hypothetical protein
MMRPSDDPACIARSAEGSHGAIDDRAAGTAGVPSDCALCGILAAAWGEAKRVGRARRGIVAYRADAALVSRGSLR